MDSVSITVSVVVSVLLPLLIYFHKSLKKEIQQLRDWIIEKFTTIDERLTRVETKVDLVLKNNNSSDKKS